MPTIIVALLIFLTVHEVSGIRCLCITKEKRPIGRYVGAVEISPASSHCKDTEIIATLKKNGQKVCLDPNAPWVKKVLERKRLSRHFEEDTLPDVTQLGRRQRQ